VAEAPTPEQRCPSRSIESSTVRPVHKAKKCRWGAQGDGRRVMFGVCVRCAELERELADLARSRLTK
jgi:hypothetical protein